MAETLEARSILVDALLAGHTLLTRRDEGWIAQEIDATGRLRPARPHPADPADRAWRGRHAPCH